MAISPELHAAGKLRAESLGHQNFSAYLRGLIRMDIINSESVDHAKARRLEGLHYRKLQMIEEAMLASEKEAEARWPAVEAEDGAFVQDLMNVMAAAPASPSLAAMPRPVPDRLLQLAPVFVSRSLGSLTTTSRIVRRGIRG